MSLCLFQVGGLGRTKRFALCSLRALPARGFLLPLFLPGSPPWAELCLVRGRGKEGEEREMHWEEKETSPFISASFWGPQLHLLLGRRTAPRARL